MPTLPRAPLMACTEALLPARCAPAAQEISTYNYDIGLKYAQPIYRTGLQVSSTAALAMLHSNGVSVRFTNHASWLSRGMHVTYLQVHDPSAMISSSLRGHAQMGATLVTSPGTAEALAPACCDPAAGNDPRQDQPTQPLGLHQRLQLGGERARLQHVHGPAASSTSSTLGSGQ